MEISSPYTIIAPTGARSPILVSVPHCGTHFPEALKPLFRPEKIAQPDDTDWFVHQLYDFVGDMGITLIHANYSRWVIDLNRDPASKPLYNDGRIITGLLTTTDFFGEPIYKDENFQPSELQIAERIEHYYAPYHNKINELLNELKQSFDHVLLWDAHSIRKEVPTIRKEPFPNLILGDNDETTANKKLIAAALNHLESSEYGATHNFPFKGGYITRNFGQPEKGIHALQLEMAKTVYMDDSETKYHNERAEKARNLLRTIFTDLTEQLSRL
jgi:N-formylglutamate amidohydrolase